MTSCDSENLIKGILAALVVGIPLIAIAVFIGISLGKKLTEDFKTIYKDD